MNFSLLEEKTKETTEPPPPNRNTYQFCNNVSNPWHSCSQHCMSKYWPGNRKYKLSFCKENHSSCGLSCAQKYGPRETLGENQFKHVSDPTTRYMIYCIMNWGL